MSRKTSYETQTAISALELKIDRFKNNAAREQRELTVAENSIVNDLQAELHYLKSQPANGPVTMPGGSFNPGRSDGFSSFGEQMMAIANASRPGGQADPRLYNAASGLNETVPSEGGFLIQSQFSSEIIQDAIQVAMLANRCRRQPIGVNANGIKINGVDETSRATGSRFGGIQSYWIDEAAEKTASKPKFRQIELVLKKNIGLCYVTDELLGDAVALGAFLREAFPAEIAFALDDAILNGSGAGQPLGILNSGCKVVQDKETGQAASTVVFENIVKMYSRSLGNSSRYVWLISKTVLPQLLTMSLPVGTGGGPVYLPAGGTAGTPENRLLGLPVLEVEQCQALGTEGDIILANFRDGYILAEKGGIRIDMSIHVRFVYDESCFRFVLRIDGQPVRASALTPYKGGAGATQSHFVTLQTRS